MNPPNNIVDANMILDTAIANIVFALQSSFHSSLQTTPGALAFGRDMILDLPVVADLNLIRERKQQLIDERLITANRKRFSYDYHVGDEIMKLIYKPDKLQPRAEGPYPIVQVHTNGTVTIQKALHLIERINVCSIKPYQQ